MRVTPNKTLFRKAGDFNLPMNFNLKNNIYGNSQYLLLSFSVNLKLLQKKSITVSGTSLAVQWLKLCTSSVGGIGSIPGQRTKIPHATWCSQKKKSITIFLNVLENKNYLEWSKPHDICWFSLSDKAPGWLTHLFQLSGMLSEGLKPSCFTRIFFKT